MLHELTSDQDMLRDTTARFLSDRVPLSKLRKDRDHPAGFDPDYWRQGAELGWTMLLVGEDERRRLCQRQWRGRPGADRL